MGGGVERCNLPPFLVLFLSMGGIYLPPAIPPAACSPGLSTAEYLSSSSPFSNSDCALDEGDFKISAAILEAFSSRSLYSAVLRLLRGVV